MDRALPGVALMYGGTLASIAGGGALGIYAGYELGKALENKQPKKPEGNNNTTTPQK